LLGYYNKTKERANGQTIREVLSHELDFIFLGFFCRWSPFESLRVTMSHPEERSVSKDDFGTASYINYPYPKSVFIPDIRRSCVGVLSE
jgi:hypothetical protein